MAVRRMFSKEIVESDAFLELPISAQALYFHLGMKADDDGFIGNPQAIRKGLKLRKEDLNILIEKRFLIAFDCGIVVIKHWHICNAIRRDRKVDTNYFKEKNMLDLEPNGAYTEKRQPSDSQLVANMTAQVSIGKFSNKKEEKKKIEKEKRNSDVFALVESYFKRPLSQMECNVIDSWIDNYSYSDIQNAITLTKSSNNNNYKSIRYIDTVLLNNFSKDKEKENDKENNESELDDVIDLSQIDWLKN